MISGKYPQQKIFFRQFLFDRFIFLLKMLKLIIRDQLDQHDLCLIISITIGFHHLDSIIFLF